MHRANQQTCVPKNHMARVGTVCSYFSRGKLELRDYVNISRRGKKGKEKEMQDSTNRIKIEFSKSRKERKELKEQRRRKRPQVARGVPLEAT